MRQRAVFSLTVAPAVVLVARNAAHRTVGQRVQLEALPVDLPADVAALRAGLAVAGGHPDLVAPGAALRIGEPDAAELAIDLARHVAVSALRRARQSGV